MGSLFSSETAAARVAGVDRPLGFRMPELSDESAFFALSCVEEEPPRLTPLPENDLNPGAGYEPEDG